MLTRKIAVYDFHQLTLSALVNADFLKGPFYLLFPVPEIPSEETVLLSVPDALVIRMIRRSYDDNLPGATAIYRGSELPEIVSLREENVFLYNDTNEWILETAFTMLNRLTREKETFTLRVPMSHPDLNGGSIALYYDGTWLRYMRNGEVLNENKGHDCFEPAGEISVHPSFTQAMTAPAESVPVSYREQTEEGVGDFYMPHGWNAFAGDVMNYYHNGVYHVLFLLDRRHHHSWNGRGAHYIAHLTSENLVDWQEQEPAVPITQPWQSFGTGTMAFHDGKYYMSYGLHSERYVWSHAKEMALLEDWTQHAVFDGENACSERSYASILAEGKTPVGATYSVSSDGIHFVPSEQIYHSARNPSVYTDGGNKLTLWAGLSTLASQNGIWEAPRFGAPFIRSEESRDDIAHPLIPYSTECPSLFSWNGYRYLVIGWSGYFRTTTPGSGAMTDAVAAGESIYDGLGVPMVCGYKDNRMLIAGWLRSIGWGSVILHRELIQEPSGKLGMKWVPEMIPETRPGNLASGSDLNAAPFALERGRSYLISLTLRPDPEGRTGLRFEDASGAACELQLDYGRRRAQINAVSGDGLSEPIPALYEMSEQVAGRSIWELDDIPQKGTNFCLPDIDGMDREFTLRVLLRCSPKMDSTVIDAEIAGCRTIVSGRTRFFPTAMRVLQDGGATVTDATVQELTVPVH